MRSAQEIADMWERLDDNIREHGWDPTVDGAARALSWALQLYPDSDDSMLRKAMERTEVERRRDWIARGGEPAEWPVTDKPQGEE